MDWESVAVRRVAGTDWSLCPIVFSNDNRKAFLASRETVAVVNVSDGRRERLLRHPETDKPSGTNVVAMHFVPYELLLITYTDGGLRSEWNLETGAINSSVQLPIDQPVFTARHSSDGTQLVVCKSQESSLCIFKLVEEKRKFRAESFLQTDAHEVASAKHIAVTDDFLAVCDKEVLFVYVFDPKSVQKFLFTGKMRVFRGKPVAFVQVVASGDSIAATLSFGRIFVWNKVTKFGITTPSRNVHWHKSAPCIGLTPAGSLVSGGWEGALLKYSFGGTTVAGAPSILPHMQSHVASLSLSQDGSHMAVVLADNSVHFVVLATMTILASAQTLLRRLRQRQPLMPTTHDPLHVHTIVSSPRPGTLQWMDLSTGLMLDTAEISEWNVPDAVCEGDRAGVTEVVSAAFTAAYAATSESRIDDVIPLNRLRFWRRVNERKCGTLSLEYECLYDEQHPVLDVRGDADGQVFVAVDALGVLSVWERCGSEEERPWRKTRHLRFGKSFVRHLSTIRVNTLAAIHSSQPRLLDTTVDAGVDDSKQEDGVLILWRVGGEQKLRPVECVEGDGRLKAAEWIPQSAFANLLVASSHLVMSLDAECCAPLWVCYNPEATARLTIGLTLQYAWIIDDSSVYICGGTKMEPFRVVKHGLSPSSIRNASVVAVGSEDDFKIVIDSEEGVTVVGQESSRRGDNAAADSDARAAADAKRTPFSRLLLSVERPGDVSTRRLPADSASSLTFLSGSALGLAPLPNLAVPFLQSCLQPPLKSS